MPSRVLEIKFGLDYTQVAKGLKAVGGQIAGFTDKARAAGKTLGGIFAQATIIAGVTKLIQAGSKLETQYAKFGTVFSENFQDAERVSQELQKSLFLTDALTKEFLSTVGDLVGGFGASSEVALETSKRITELGVKLSAFQGIDTKSAIDAITKSFMGENEAIKMLGISIRDNAVQQKVAELGLKNLTGTQRVLAEGQIRLQMAFDQSKKSIEGFATTSQTAGFMLGNVGDSISQLIAQVGLSITSSDQFKTLMVEISNVFADPAFIEGIKSVTGAIIALGKGLAWSAGNIVKYAGAIASLAKEEDTFNDMMTRDAEQFDETRSRFLEFVKTLDESTDVYKNLVKEYEKVPEVIRDTAGKVKDLSEAQKDSLRHILVLQGHTDGYTNATGRLHQVLNDVIKGKFGTEIAQQFREFAKGEREAIDGQVALANSTKKTTEEIQKLTPAMQILADVQNKYGLSASLAEEFLEALNPELSKQIQVSEKYKVSMEEAGRVIRDMNILEKERKDGLESLNDAELKRIQQLKGISDPVIEYARAMREAAEEAKTLEGVSEEFDDILAEMGIHLDDVADGVNVIEGGFTTGLNPALDEANMLWVEHAFKTLDALQKMEQFGGALSQLSSLTFLPDKLAQGFQNLSGVLMNLASGNVLGAIISGLSGLFGLFSSGEDEQEAFNAANEAARKELANLGFQINLSEEAMDALTRTIMQYQAAGKSAAQATRDFIKANREARHSILENANAGENLIAQLNKQNLTQNDLNSIERQTIMLMHEMRRAGFSNIEIFEELGGPIDLLGEKFDEMGLSGTDAFKELLAFRKKLEDNKTLIDSIEGYRNNLELLGLIGSQSQDDFNKFQNDVLRQYDQLKAAGFSENEILQLLGPTLKELGDIAKENGLTLDGNVKSLLDMAEASGQVGDADPMERMTDGVDRMADALDKLVNFFIGPAVGAVDEFGNAVSDKFDDISERAESALNRIRGGVEGLSSATEGLGISITEAGAALRGAGDGGGGGGGGAPPRLVPRGGGPDDGFARGGSFMVPMSAPFYTARVHPGEHVQITPANEVGRLRTTQGGGMSGSRGGGDSFAVNATIVQQPGQSGQALFNEIVKAAERDTRGANRLNKALSKSQTGG